MLKMIISVMLLLMACTHSMAAERKALGDVDNTAFTADTQATPKGAGDDHVALVWWIPNEFWESVFSRDPNTSQADKRAMLDALAADDAAELTPIENLLKKRDDR